MINIKNLFLPIFLLSLLFSCSSPEAENLAPPPVRLKINSHSEPVSSDPRKATDITTSSLMKMLYDGLTRFQPNGELSPSIAERYDISSNQLTYTFYLKNTNWSDGSSLTAFDFERSWKKALNPTFPSASSNLMYIIKNAEAVKKGLKPLDELGVKALDNSRLEVTLENPVPYFLQLLALPAFFPVHPSLEGIDFTLDQLVTNGPFNLKEWISKDHIFVTKSESYWDRSSVKLDEIHISLVEDEHTELNLFENNELHWAGSPISTVPTDAILALKEREVLKTHPLSSTYWYKFNTKAFPFNNANIRKAFAAAINREAIIKHITQANQSPALTPVPPIYNLKTDPIFKDGDLSAARAFLEQGLKELDITKEELNITLSYSTGERHQKITQAIQDQWKKAFDIDVKLQNFEWQILLQKLAKHDFQIAGRGWVAEFSDPIYFLEPYAKLNSEHGGNNDTQWHNEKFTKLLEDAQASADSNKRLSLLRQAEAIFLEEMPVIPFFHSTLVFLKDPKLEDVCISELSNFDFKWAYFSQEKEESTL
jgi:oligopeptide transport system substrate-binding protein